MEVNEEINKILDKDEEIIYRYKPNKMRFVFFGSLSSILIGLIFGGPFAIIGALGVAGVIRFDNEGSSGNDVVGASVFMVMGLLVISILLFRAITLIVRYRKTIFLVTNKRIIVRNGFIGADYNSLNLASISMVNVRVDFLDKLIKPNTGTITFASSAVPITSGNSRGSSLDSFAFSHVENPYDVYQEVKSYIDEKNIK